MSQITSVWLEDPALLCTVYVPSAISSFTLLAHLHISFTTALSQILSLWIYCCRHLLINKDVSWENKAYFLAVTPSVVSKQHSLRLFSLYYEKYWRETPSPGSNMSACLCQCSSERERSDANWMTNSPLRWSDDRIRLTWKLGGVHVWVCVCQKRDIARRVITVWMLGCGWNHAVHWVSTTELDLNKSAVALLALKRDPSMISSLMITDSTPNISGVRD